MNVVARTDPHAAHQDVYDAHPDWIAVDAKGKKRRHWADPEIVGDLRAGPLQLRVHDRRSPTKSSRSTRWTASSAIAGRARACATASTARQNFEITPASICRARPIRRTRRGAQYILWQQQRLFELWRLWDTEIKAINPNARFLANSGGGALSELDMKTIGELAPTLFADRQARSGLMPAVGERQKRQGIPRHHGRKADRAESSAWAWKRHIAGRIRCRAADEIRLWVADGIAKVCGPGSPNSTPSRSTSAGCRWWRSFTTGIIGTSEYLRNEKSLADVAMVYSQQTAAFYGGDGRREGGRSCAGLLSGAGGSAHAV